MFAGFPFSTIYAQEGELPYAQWISRLTERNDIRSQNYFKVVDDLKVLDSTVFCRAIEALKEKGPANNKRFLIQYNRLVAQMVVESQTCPEWKNIEELQKDALRYAYEIEDPVLIAAMNRLLAAYYRNREDFGSASMYGLIAKEMESKLGVQHFNDMAYFRYDLGFILYHAREYEKSIQASKEAITWEHYPGRLPNDTLSDYYKMVAWNTIGLSYGHLGKYDSAFIAFDNALQYKSYPFWENLIQGNKGDTYFKQGKYELAEPLLLRDVESSFQTAQYDNAANSIQWLARIHSEQGKEIQALKEVRQAKSWLEQMPRKEFEVNMLFTFTQVFKALGNTDSMDFYMKKYLALHDSLEKKAADDRAEIVELRIENQDAIHQIVLLNKQKKSIALIRNLIIVMILLASCIGYLYFNRQRLKMQMKQRQVLEDKRRAELIAAESQQKLNDFTQNMLEKSALVEVLQGQLLQKQLNSELISAENELSHFTILTDEDWDKFKQLFESVYPGFFLQLKNKAPDITLAEQRMAALSKLQIPAKKAATILGISPNSVHKTRQRLRNRLGLEMDADLETYF